MTRSRSPVHGIIQELGHIKIEDEEEAMLPIDLTDLDDEQEGPETIREITPSEAHDAGGLPFGCITLASTKLYGEDILPGDNLEFEDGSFLHDIRIFEDSSTGLIILDGNRLVRKRELDGMLARDKVNELCLMLRAPTAGVDAKLRDCRATRPLSAAICKRHIIFTNQKFPAHSVYEYPYYPTSSMPVIRECAQLVCRWRFTEETTNSGSKVTAGSLMALSEADCDETARASDICLLKKFLSDKCEEAPTSHTKAETVQDAEWEFVDLVEEQETPKKRRHDAFYIDGQIDLTDDCDGDVQVYKQKRKTTETFKHISSTSATISENKTSTTTQESTRTIPSLFASSKVLPSRSSDSVFSPVLQRQKRRESVEAHTSGSSDSYTFADICTGGGGMASGAHQAGLKINFVLDECQHACRTLRLNFRETHTNVLIKDIYEFCTSEGSFIYEKVDVLHISYPCQPHSALYTVEGKNHDKNIGALYSIGPILERCKPRIVTLEQTSGIVTHRGGGHFRALIRQITDAGYNVRWKICNLAEYGNVQPRKRLIIIAACLGETLPSFPETTHGLGPGKLSFVTINDVLKKIRHLQVPRNLQHYTLKDGQPYDGNQPLKGCITCDGGTSNMHPNGKRTFTLFELAALQGFLPTHRFSGRASSHIMRQIGNAVPSMFAKKLFAHIILSLQESDRRMSSYQPEVVNLD